MGLQEPGSDPASMAASRAAQTGQGGGWMDTILNLIPGRKQKATDEPNEDAIKRTHDYLRSGLHSCVSNSHGQLSVSSPCFNHVIQSLVGRGGERESHAYALGFPPAIIQLIVFSGHSKLSQRQDTGTALHRTCRDKPQQQPRSYLVAPQDLKTL